MVSCLLILLPLVVPLPQGGGRTNRGAKSLNIEVFFM